MPQKVNVGITISSEYGIVSEYEEREAAIFGMYNYEQWQELHWTERAKVVAHYRLHNLVEAHVQQAAEKPASGRKR